MKPVQIDVRPLACALLDGCALVLAILGAAALLDPEGIKPEEVQGCSRSSRWRSRCRSTVNVFFGVYQGVWRYTSLPDIQRIVFSVLAGTVCCRSRCASWPRIEPRLARLPALPGAAHRAHVARAHVVPLVQGMEPLRPRRRAGHRRSRSMGAGDAAVGLLKELSRSHEWRVVGLLDDDEKKRGPPFCTACA
jgi:FlaA1/EpsC-like NDP-sugar epimerase